MRYYYKCLGYDDKIRFIKEIGLKGYTFGYSRRRNHISYMNDVCGPDTIKWLIATIDEFNKNVEFIKHIPLNTPEYRSDGKKVYNMDRFRFI